jgi:monoamine oxidase
VEPQPQIAIIGAGIAGLSCALALADREIPFRVFEASNRVGGRLHTIRGYWDDGQTGEWCGELLNGDAESVFALARRFGIAVQPFELPSGAARYRLGGRDIDGAELAAAFREAQPLLQAAVEDLPYPFDWCTVGRAGRALDELSFADWVGEHLPGGPRAPLGQALLHLYSAEYGADPEELSALNVLMMVADQDPETFGLLGAADDRFRLVGGLEQLAEAVAAALPEGSLVLDVPLEEIVQDERGVGLRFASGWQRFDAVVLALPFSVLRELDISRARFDVRKQRAIAELGAGRVAKLALQFDRRLWREQDATGDGLDSRFHSIWEATRGQAGQAGVLVSYSGGRAADFDADCPPFSDASEPAVAALARKRARQFDELYPGIAACWNGKATLSLPAREPLFRSCYSFWKPGQISSFAGHERVRQGRVLFAGEHTSTTQQGFINGAAEEGIRAAFEVATLCA